MDTTDIDKMNNLPFVRLYVNKRCGVDGGHLVNAFVNPKISTGIVTDASKHQLIPLNEDGSIIDLGWSFSTSSSIIGK